MVSEIFDDLYIYTEPTGHRWVDLYNEYGPKGFRYSFMKILVRPCKCLSNDQLDEFNRIAENEDYFTKKSKTNRVPFLSFFYLILFYLHLN
ncbi:MAG: hypothetical protein LBD03_05925 [Methanobrevibacter sp.]|jgi:hypothetical protein|nr:hypothetical protein [Candidatus Methanovirga procula]